ncbi:T9SS type A sorting domain-containing protein [Gaetbulibacter jejuensis]|uniref:T9SS type A sorting domain-containing protein n=1 Tax=Gaetbulibacter jejuensis TaxID=584607 RepID=UPI00300BC997
MEDLTLNSKNITIFPNPSSDFIQISGLTKTEKYILYNILGTKIRNGVISDNEKMDIQNLTKGLYFLKFENEHTIKFIKE